MTQAADARLACNLKVPRRIIAAPAIRQVSRWFRRDGRDMPILDWVGEKAVGNALRGMPDTLPALEESFTRSHVVDAEGCTVPDNRLSSLGVVFQQIPYQIEEL